MLKLHFVVSFTGTWVETVHELYAKITDEVVSFTGTWVETSNAIPVILDISVVSFTGTWVETYIEFYVER